MNLTMLLVELLIIGHCERGNLWIPVIVPRMDRLVLRKLILACGITMSVRLCFLVETILLTSLCLLAASDLRVVIRLCSLLLETFLPVVLGLFLSNWMMVPADIERN